jgi:exonuclease VII small subunit
MYSCSVANYERERVKLTNDCETKIEQLEKKVKNDVDHEKDEKEKALAKV